MKKHSTLLTTAALIVILGFGEWLGWSATWRTVASSIILPLRQTGAALTYLFIRPVDGTWKTWQAAVRIQDLELRLREAEAQAAETQGVKVELAALQASCMDATVSGLPSRARRFSASILAYGKPAITGGAEAQIQTGAAVLSQNNLVGVVGQVWSTYAGVILLSDSTLPPILAKTEHGVIGILTGQSHQVWLTQVPADQVIGPGEVVTTVGQAGISPNLFVGKTGVVDANPGAPSIQVELDQFAHFADASIVEVRSW